MAISPEIIGQFVDAAVKDPALADKLFEQHPDLKTATWIGASILRFCAIENYPQGVRYLGERGWVIDERDDDATTPLIEAVRAGAKEAVRTLLELGADPNAVSAIYDNALHCAIGAGDTRMMRILLDAGANPAYTTELGETALDVIPNKPGKSGEIRSILMEHGLVTPDA